MTVRVYTYVLNEISATLKRLRLCAVTSLIQIYILPLLRNPKLKTYKDKEIDRPYFYIILPFLYMKIISDKDLINTQFITNPNIFGTILHSYRRISFYLMVDEMVLSNQFFPEQSNIYFPFFRNVIIVNHSFFLHS